MIGLTVAGLSAAGCAHTASSSGPSTTVPAPATAKGSSAYGGPTTPGGENQQLATEATVTYRDQLAATTTAFTAATADLQSAAARGDVPAGRTAELDAQADYDAFRVLEVGASSDVPRIDQLQSDVDPGATFDGLHAIERDLWTSGPLEADIDALVGQTPLQRLLMARPLLVTRQQLSPEAIGTTAVDELSWVVDSALPHEQEQYSHLGLVDIDATTGAAAQAFGDLEPLGRRVAPGLTADVAARFTALDAAEHALGDPTTVSDASITAPARLALAEQLDATASTLARLAALLTPYGTRGGTS